MVASLLCLDRLTLSNVIVTSGFQHLDWTADYRLYAKARVDSQALFAPVIAAAVAHLPALATLVIAVDDTLRRKSGPKIHGVAWRRDPLGPPFQTNLVRGQRYQQFSVAWPVELPPPVATASTATMPPMPPTAIDLETPSLANPNVSKDPADAIPVLANPHASPAKMVPIAFCHTPGVAKLPKKLQDDEDAKTLHRAERKRLALTTQTLKHLQLLLTDVPADRPVLLVGDGSYTNATILKGLPKGISYLGRTRKDMALHYPPPPAAPPAKGRRPAYGASAPTPEALRQDDSIPWVKIQAYASGCLHSFKIKTLEGVQWRKAGAERRFRIIVIAPLGYRLKKNSKMLYRQPAYLISTMSTGDTASTEGTDGTASTNNVETQSTASKDNAQSAATTQSIQSILSALGASAAGKPQLAEKKLGACPANERRQSQRSVGEELQSYLWRWGIEVNHREDKTLIGVGDAQVRTENSNQHLPASAVAAYSLLMVAGLHSQAEDPAGLPPLTRPKWRQASTATGIISAGELVRQLRFDYWSSTLRSGHYYRFVTETPPDTNAEKLQPDLAAALFCAA